MMVFNEGEGKPPVKTLEGKFEVIIPDTSDSLYNKPNFK
jgi:hypothetical protein